MKNANISVNINDGKPTEQKKTFKEQLLLIVVLAKRVKSDVRENVLHSIRQIMQPGKTYCHTCFAWAKDATTSFA